MRSNAIIIVAGAIAAAGLVGAPALAVDIPDGTLSVAILGSPSVSIGASSSTVSFSSILAAGYSPTGGFAASSGTINGTLAFSNVTGSITPVSLASFFTFTGAGITYTFSADSITTQFVMDSPASSTISLYLLGSTIAPGYSATPTSFTISLNSTAGSPYAASATLAVPPAQIFVPEASTWMLMVAGFGLIGATLRRRSSQLNVSFS